MKHDEIRRVVAREHLLEHLVEHLPFRRRTVQTVDDHPDTAGILRRDLVGHAKRALVIGIDAEIDEDIRLTYPRQVAFDHAADDILLVPVRDKDGGARNHGVPVSAGPKRVLADAQSKQIDKGVVERTQADKQAYRQDA